MKKVFGGAFPVFAFPVKIHSPWHSGKPASKTVRLFVASLLFFSFLFYGSPWARAEQNPAVPLTAEEQNWLRQNPDKLTLYYNVEFPPIEFVSDKGAFIGMGADIVALVEKKLGVTFLKRSSRDWNKHLAALESGQCAVAPTIVSTPERKRYAFFTTPYAEVPVVMITSKAFQERLSFDDLDGRRVVVVSGFATEKCARDRSQNRFDVIPVKNVSEGLRAVAFGQADVLLENLAVASYFIDKEGIANLHVAGDTDYVFAWSIGVSRKYPHLFSAIQKALDAIPESEIELIRKRWISLNPEVGLDAHTRRLLELIGLFAALLIVGLTIISLVFKRRLNEKVFTLKTAQQKLLDQSELLRLATEATQAGAWDSHPATQTVYLSAQWLSMLNYPPEDKEFSLSSIFAFIHPEDQAGVRQFFEKYINSGGRKSFEAEYRLKRADGSWCWVLSKGKAVAWDSANHPTRIIGLDMNIQQIKEDQEKMAQNEAWFRAIFEEAPFSIVINRVNDGEYLEANKKFLEYWKISKEDLPSLKVEHFLIMSGKDRQEISDQLIKTGAVKNREVVVQRKGGMPGYLIFSSVLLNIRGEKQILSMTVDITERKQMEEALRASETRYRSLYDSMMDAYALVDMNGGIRECNKAFLNMMEYGTDEISTLTYRDITPEKWRLWEEEIVLKQVVPRGFSDTYEKEFVRKDGSILPVELRTYLLRKDDGKPAGMWAIIRDISERKRAEEEREKMQGQMLQSQKLEAVGVLAGGVAHDFNNILSAIIGYAEIIMRRMNPSDPNRKNLSKILDAAQRSANLTRQLLAFARKQTIVPIVFDVHESVGALLKMIRRLIGENIELDWLPVAGPCFVRMDPSQFDQILLNLCVNARDAISTVGRIVIQTQTASFDLAACEAGDERIPGEFISLSVSDNGRGMDTETLDHIFEPFFTTKGVGEGTGMGLATVYGIVKQNNGFINVDSEPNRGTTFKIFIPRHSDDVRTGEREKREGIPRSRGETVLLVEDDPTVLEMTVMMLRHLGYFVIPAGSPKEAIRIAEENLSDIHLFITDVVMPEMNGRDLADRLQTIRPGIRHLFMSGYTADVIAHQGALDDGVNFIHKPFSLKDLAIKIREVVG